MTAINTEQTPKETVYRSKDNSCFHVSSFKDMVLNPTEIVKPYFGFLLFGSDYQKFYDFYQSQKVNTKVRILNK